MDILYSTLVVLQYPMRDPTVYGNVKGDNNDITLSAC